MNDPDLCSGFTVEGDACPREHDADGRHVYPADDGHTFRLTGEIRGSYAVLGEPHHADHDEYGAVAFVTEVRAWDLPQALSFAALLPLASWDHQDRDRPPVEQARGLAVQLENRLAHALSLHTPSVEREALLEWEEPPPCPVCRVPVPCPTALALQPDVYADEKPAHYAEAFRQDAPDLRWGWQCLLCDAEEYVEDAATAELMAGWHNEGRLFVVDGMALLWPEDRRPGDSYPLCPGCGHDFGGHYPPIAEHGGCPTCHEARTPCTVDQAAVFVAIERAVALA